MRALGGPWSPVAPDGAEAYRYSDPDDAAAYARERARSTGQTWRVVDGLRGPRKGPGPLPAGVRLAAAKDALACEIEAQEAALPK